MIVDGKIMVCDICKARKIYDESKPLPERCWNYKCRRYGWNTKGEDRRTWDRVKREANKPKAS